jgi:hypothetical protein
MSKTAINRHFEGVANKFFSLLKIDNIEKATASESDIAKLTKKIDIIFIAMIAFSFISIIATGGLISILVMAVTAYSFGIKTISVPELIKKIKEARDSFETDTVPEH